MEKKILIIIYTHGDEKIGEEIVERLKNKGLYRFFDCLVANPKAAEKNVRFIEADLNRCYPGEKDSAVYEKKQASKNLEIAKKYEFIIDVHEATSGINDFIIIPREQGTNSFPLNLINLNTVLFWPNPKGPIGQILENSIELEFGTKNRDRTEIAIKAESILETFINCIYSENDQNNFTNKQIYFVYGKLMTTEIQIDQELVDFKKTNIKGEEFYPLLVGQYKNIGIECYKMKTVDNYELFC
jgi:succinylglutamate desuccinylase